MEGLVLLVDVDTTTWRKGNGSPTEQRECPEAKHVILRVRRVGVGELG